MKYDLKHGDCEILMQSLENNSIDLIVTSPPYDNIRSYNGSINQWNFEKFKQIAKQLYRIVKDGGVVVWIVSDQTVYGSETGTSFKQALYFMSLGFFLHDTMIWEKDTFSLPCKTRYQSVFEYMLVLSKGKPKTINLIQDRKNKYAGMYVHGTSRDKNGNTFTKSNNKKKIVKENGIRYNVWKIACEKHNVYGHPAVFPVRLAQDHIISWSNENDIVLDPFMGSGSTGIACMNTNRNFIGMELNDEYFEIAKKRMEEHFVQQSMF